MSLLDKLQRSFKAASFDTYINEHSLTVNAEQLPEVLNKLKTDKQYLFTQLIGIFGADYPERNQRFEVVYLLLSMKHNQRLKVKVQMTENDTLPSVVNIYSAAGWYERETWDMYGIKFANNPDLRRILTDYGFEGHPLRKDFPLTGYVEVRYDNEKKDVIYEPVQLKQEYRDFDFLSPWEGLQKEL